MKKVISLLLAILMTVSIFASCGDQTGQPTPSETPAESPEETPAETEKPEVTLSVAEGIRCNYTVIRPEMGSDRVVGAAVKIRKALVEAGAKDATIKEDFLYGDLKPAEFEILVGQTNREESARALESAKYDDYYVIVDGNKIVINSYNDEMVEKAADEFISALTIADGKISFSNKNERIHKAEYRYDDVKIGGKSLMGYRIVRAGNANSAIKNIADAFQRKVIELSGIYLPIVADSKGATEKEIVIGSTSRVQIDEVRLEKYGYAVKLEGERIFMVASDNDFTLIKSMDLIVSELEAGEVALRTDKLNVSDSPILTSMCFSDVHNNFAMLQPNNSSGDYVVRRNVDWMIDHLLETEGAVDVVMVGGDYMSDYPNWNSSGYLPYKYYLGFKAKTIETFNRLAKDGKVMYVAGNHDYAQGESFGLKGPGKNGSYNSFDFYFDGPMDKTFGQLADEDKLVKVGEHTGEEYLLGYYYEVNGIHFVGFAPDPDLIWSEQGYGFTKEQFEWLDKKLDEIDPTGTEVIFVNCHYALSQRVTSSDLNAPYIDGTATAQFEPVLRGHRNLFYMFGHWHTFNSYHKGATVKNVLHYNNNGQIMNIKGTETESTQVSGSPNRSFTAVWMGGFRLDWSSGDGKTNADKFNGDFVTGTYSHPSTGTPRMAQGMYIEVYPDRVVFQMKNIGDYPGFSTEDVLAPYTVYLYK